jgi:hypothetical protein
MRETIDGVARPQDEDYGIASCLPIRATIWPIVDSTSALLFAPELICLLRRRLVPTATVTMVYDKMVRL